MRNGHPVKEPIDKGDASGYPKWFEGLADQAGRKVTVFCPRCGAQLTVLGCTVPPWTGYIIQPHRCGSR